VLSVFLGEQQLIAARRSSIEASCSEMRALEPFMHKALEREIRKVDAVWNARSMLKERRKGLRKHMAEVRESLSNKAEHTLASLEDVSRHVFAKNQPTRLLVEIEHGAIVAAREVLPQSGATA
jgi:hypothetical protein